MGFHESPLVDHQVDRPDVYAQQCAQLTGTNGRKFDHMFSTLGDLLALLLTLVSASAT